MEKYNIPIEMTDDQIFAAKRGNFMDSDEAKMSGENHVSDEQKPFDMTDEQISKAQFGEFLETMKEDFVSSREPTRTSPSKRVRPGSTRAGAHSGGAPTMRHTTVNPMTRRERHPVAAESDTPVLIPAC
jgi:hypothetical protein